MQLFASWIDSTMAAVQYATCYNKLGSIARMHAIDSMATWCCQLRRTWLCNEGGPVIYHSSCFMTVLQCIV